MQTITRATEATATAEAQERSLRQQGYLPGVPRHIDERTQSIDAQVCRQMRCPGCRRRGMQYRPFTKGQAYRVLAACAHCPAAEEV